MNDPVDRGLFLVLAIVAKIIAIATG